MPASPRDRTVVVPFGLSSKLGVYGTSVLAIVALVSAVLDGDYTAETITALAGAVVTLATTVYGRMLQAAAIYRNAESPLQGAQDAIGVLNQPVDPPSVPPAR